MTHIDQDYIGPDPRLVNLPVAERAAVARKLREFAAFLAECADRLDTGGPVIEGVAIDRVQQ